MTAEGPGEWVEAKNLTTRINDLLEGRCGGRHVEPLKPLAVASVIEQEFGVKYTQAEITAIHDGGGCPGG